MRNFRKQLSVFLCAIMIISVFSFFSYASGGVVCELENGCLYVSGSGAMTDTFEDNTDIDEVYVERGVTSIPDGAFSNCVNLSRVTMSNSVVSVGSGAFGGCAKLSEAVLSQNIASLEANLFYGCESLSQVKVPEAAAIIRNGAFGGCISLKSLIITQNVTEIEDGSFDGCSALEKVFYAGASLNWENVLKEDGLFSQTEFECIAPVIGLNQTYSSGKTVLSFVLEKGRINALDFQVTPTGSSSIYKIKVAAGLTSTYNKNNGMISLASGSSFLTVGKEIAAVTLNVTDCENYSAEVAFNSCYALIDNVAVNVPVIYNGKTVGGHSCSDWTVTKAPSQNDDGEAENSCVCCGESVVKGLPFAFKNCALKSDSIIFISEYGMTANDFASHCVSFKNASVALSDSEFVGTGSSVTADYSDGIVFDYTVALKGDADGDGFCDAQDAVIIACINEGMISSDSLELCVSYACDCTENDVIDADDVLFAEQSGLKLI